MATIRKRVGKKGKTAWQIDYYDPQGRRVMKCFKFKKNAEVYLAGVEVGKNDGDYEEKFKPKEEKTFADLVAKYIENYGSQKSFKSFKRHAVRYLLEAFGSRRVKDISYLDLETYRNKRKASAKPCALWKRIAARFTSSAWLSSKATVFWEATCTPRKLSFSKSDEGISATFSENQDEDK